MGIDALKRAFIGRAVGWLRVYNQNYDMAVFVNDHIGGAIITYGQYEKQYLEMTRQVLIELTGNESFKDGTCLDIGANIGNHALFYSTIFKQVIAFEPNPIAYKLLEANILKNRIANIRICTTALGSKKEKKVLSICHENLGMSSLVQETKTAHPSFNLEIEINVGDDLIEEMVDDQSGISFIKLDVEGFEAEALKGLRKTISKYRPIISIELNFASLNKPSEAALNVLADLGYKNFYVLERPHSFRNRYLNFMSRVILGEKLVLSKLDKFEPVDYQQIFCVANPVATPNQNKVRHQ